MNDESHAGPTGRGRVHISGHSRLVFKNVSMAWMTAGSCRYLICRQLQISYLQTVADIIFASSCRYLICRQLQIATLAVATSTLPHSESYYEKNSLKKIFAECDSTYTN